LPITENNGLFTIKPSLGKTCRGIFYFIGNCAFGAQALLRNESAKVTKGIDVFGIAENFVLKGE